MMHKKLLACLAAIFCLFLSGCSKDIAPGEYDSTEVGKVKKVVPGVVLSRRPVNVHAKTAENLAMPIDGSAAAPAPAAETDNSLMRSRGFEYVIRLNSGTIISIVQTEDVRLKPKQHVLVIYGNNTRVVPDEGNDD
jgi:outer membrane lipoprotein SlyB